MSNRDTDGKRRPRDVMPDPDSSLSIGKTEDVREDPPSDAETTQGVMKPSASDDHQRSLRGPIGHEEGTSSGGHSPALSEDPNQDSCRGLDRPRLESHNIEYLNTQARNKAAKYLVIAFFLIVTLQAIALTVCTLAGAPIGELSAYFQYTISAMLSLVTLVVGYFFGARASRRREQQV